MEYLWHDIMTTFVLYVLQTLLITMIFVCLARAVWLFFMGIECKKIKTNSRKACGFMAVSLFILLVHTTFFPRVRFLIAKESLSIDEKAQLDLYVQILIVVSLLCLAGALFYALIKRVKKSRKSIRLVESQEELNDV